MPKYTLHLNGKKYVTKPPVVRDETDKNPAREKQLARAIKAAKKTGETRIDRELARYYLLTRYGVEMDSHNEGVSLMQRLEDGYFTDVQFGDIDWPNATENFEQAVDAFIRRRRAWRFWEF